MGRRAGHGAEHLIEELYRDYGQRLLSYCRYRVGDPELAEDVAQETFLRALKYAHSYDPTRSPWPWLKMIAERVIIREWHRGGREGPSEDAGGVGVVAVSDLADRIAEHATLSRALTALPLTQRDAIGLRYIDGWSTTEIARALGLTRNATYTLMCRARQRLRREYEQLTDDLFGIAAVPAILWTRAALARLRGRPTAGGPTITNAPMVAEGVAPAVLAVVLGIAGVSVVLDANREGVPVTPTEPTVISAHSELLPPMSPDQAEGWGVGTGPEAPAGVAPAGESMAGSPSPPTSGRPRARHVEVSAASDDVGTDAADTGAHVTEDRDADDNVTIESRLDVRLDDQENEDGSRTVLFCQGSTVNDAACDAYDDVGDQGEAVVPDPS